MAGERGFILLLTFIFMITLTALAGALLYMVTYETRDIGIQAEDAKLLNLAEAGIQRGLRQIRDDVLTTTQTGAAYLRGADTAGSVSVGNIDRIRYVGESSGEATINDNGDIALLKTIDANYANTRIVSVYLGVRASRVSGGTGATVQVSYTTSGVFPQAGNAVLTQALTTTASEYFADITSDRSWSWPVILSANFILRAARTAGNRNINLDALFLRVNYEIDTNTESWYIGSYASFPISLGSGTIQSVTLTAEQGKAHLNTASQSLLSFLMQERGIDSATANTLAADIVTYRSSKPFDTVEELRQVSGMTLANYNLLKDFVTVYSFINSGVTRPSGARAAVNINTASREVLEAVFDTLSLGASDAASLTSDIITARSASPFTCFYSFSSSVTTDFYDFVRSRSYLSASGNPDEQDRVLDNADASSLVPVAGSSGYSSTSTEFCYDTNSFKVESLAGLQGRGMRLKTILGDDGASVFTTYAGDTNSAGYRKENFE
jgi:DNA uptake protein ComE-like DNA-binding protein